MEYLALIFLHVFFGIIWAGGAAVTGLFVVPSVMEAGPAAGAVMAGVARRRLPVLMTVASFIVILSGARLYMLRFTTYWVTSPEGIVLSLGAILALGAFAIGMIVQRPAVGRMAAISAAVAASGGRPTPEQAAELQTLRNKMQKAAALTAWHLIAAAALMASHRLAVAL